jgi:cytochrome c oxidase subunit 2
MMCRSGNLESFSPGANVFGRNFGRRKSTRGSPGEEKMLTRPSERGSTSVALAFAVFLVLMTAVTVYIFMAKIWWFPPAITDFGHEIDAQYARTFLITGIVFVAAQIGLAYAVFKFRDHGQKATYFEGNNTMEIVWTLATVVLFVGLGLYARNAWAEVHFMGASPGALQVEVTGQQFVWNFRYAGPDGKFGREKPELVSASTGNPVGLDPTDPASKDDIVSPVIVVPANREVELIIRSQDVTHSFYVRELRLKQDAVPGMEIHMHFTATDVGDYEIACAELCGLGHYRMHSMLTMMNESDFEKWVKDQEAANQ